MSRAVVAGVAGAITAAVAQFLAAMISGGGHAWTEPFSFSAAMWIMFPPMFIRVQQHRSGSRRLVWLDWFALFVAVLLDGLLVVATRGDGLSGTGTELFLRVLWMDPVLVVLWIAIWLSWQIIALYLCLAGLSGDDGSRSRVRADLMPIWVAGGLACGFVLACFAIFRWYIFVSSAGG